MLWLTLALAGQGNGFVGGLAQVLEITNLKQNFVISPRLGVEEWL